MVSENNSRAMITGQLWSVACRGLAIVVGGRGRSYVH